MLKPKPLPYDKAAFRSPNGTFDEINLEDLIDIYNQNRQKYFKEYDGNLYCPECRVPKLSFHNGHHLQKYPKSQHDDSCSRVLPYVENHVLYNWVKHVSEDFITQQSRRLLNLLCKGKRDDTHPLVIRTQNEKCLESVVKRSEISKNAKNLKSIPRKLLTAPFSPEDYNVFKLFYGTVHIKWDIRETHAYLRMYFPNDTSRLICSLSIRRDTIYPRFDKSITEINEVVVNLVFFAEMTQNHANNGISYNNSTLRRANHLTLSVR